MRDDSCGRHGRLISIGDPETISSLIANSLRYPVSLLSLGLSIVGVDECIFDLL